MPGKQSVIDKVPTLSNPGSHGRWEVSIFCDLERTFTLLSHRRSWKDVHNEVREKRGNRVL